MKIKMKKTEFGSPDGITNVKFEQGQEYDVTDRLAHVFVEQMKVAEYMGEKKMEKTAPDNKAIGKKAEKQEENERLSDSNTTKFSDDKGRIFGKDRGK